MVDLSYLKKAMEHRAEMQNKPARTMMDVMREQIATRKAIPDSRIPTDIYNGEQGLQGGFHLGTVGGVDVNATDLLPMDLGASALAKLGSLGAAKLGAIGMAGVGHTAWHGSPHLFDKFKNEAIGTGEGAQAYGHGLYLAEHPTVAGEYATKLSEPVTTFGGKQISEILDPESKRLAEWIKSNVGVMQFDARHGEANRLFNRLTPEQQSALGKPSVSDAGQLYKTDIPDTHLDKMLDWDKRLSNQHPDVQVALKDMLTKARKSFPGIDPNGDPIAGQAYHLYTQHRGGNQTAVSDELAQAGIPGIKYLDGSSRAGGEGTRNFVMFNPDDIRILERNGQPTGAQPWSADSKVMSAPEQLNSLNPTGGLYVDYNPQLRATQPLGDRMTTLAHTSGKHPDEMVTIYRGAPKSQKGINAGDFVTDMPELAKSYSGDGNVLKIRVRLGDILDDMHESLGNEYIYRPNADKELAKSIPSLLAGGAGAAVGLGLLGNSQDSNAQGVTWQDTFKKVSGIPPESLGITTPEHADAALRRIAQLQSIQQPQVTPSDSYGSIGTRNEAIYPTRK